MTEVNPFPLVRMVDVERIAQREGEVRVEASEAERADLARFLKLPAIHSLTGEFEISGNARRAKVKGVVKGRVTQICGVSLDPFETDVEEPVDLEFAEERDNLSPEEIERRKIDPPDEILDGKIDLGAVTSEFLALGLDPYPRKPGVDFQPPREEGGEKSPFAALGKLRRDD